MDHLPIALNRFEAYVSEAFQEANSDVVRTQRIVGISLGVIIFAAILIALSSWVRVPIFGFICGSVGFSFVFNAIHDRIQSAKRQKMILQNPVQARFEYVLKDIHDYSTKRTLGERLHPKVAEELEVLSKVYFHVREWLATPSAVNILGSKTHIEVQSAVKKAMREAVLVVSSSYRPIGMARKKWSKIVESDPNALQVTSELAKVTGLLNQISEVAKKVETLGATISLSDQLEAITEAINEMESNSFRTIKSLPGPSATSA